MNRPNSFPDRERILSILVLFAMILIVAQLVRVQLVGHDFWEKEARRQELTWKEQHPSRGDILDQMGRPLAVTLPLTFAVGYRPQECLDKEKLSKQLAAILEPANKSWQSRLKSDAKFTYLARRVSRQTAQKLRALNLACLELSEEPRRSYPCGSLAASVLGFADIDQKGQEGIELESDAVLRGSVVRQLVWIDAGTQSCVPLREISTPTAKGADIQLTLDVALQTIVEEELQKAMRTCRSQRACLLLTNPQTGEISALATHPTFDSNHPGNMPADARKCWPITDCMEFGSTLKILPFAGALLSNLYDESEQIFCGNGKLQVPGAVIHDAHPYSYLSFREVLQKSSNVGTVKIAQRLGKKNLYEMARRFGFGTPTGISFPGEPSGQLPSVHEWSSVTLANIAFGHGLSATPLQLAMAYGAIANGGYLMKPLLVKRIHHASGDIEQIEPAIVRQVLPHSVARTLSDMLASVVESGTGQAAAVANWRVAGKTGTAQKVDHARHQYFKDRYISSFIGFAPADAPAYLLLVVVDDPKGPYYGGQVAAPIFHDVMERIVQCRPPASSHWPAAAGHELVSSSRNKFSDDDGRNAEVSSQASQQVREMVLPQDIDTGLVRVPELEGLTFRHAIRELTLRNLTFHVIGGNEVVCQSPAPGTMVPVGTVCHLFGLSD